MQQNPTRGVVWVRKGHDEWPCVGSKGFWHKRSARRQTGQQTASYPGQTTRLMERDVMDNHVERGVYACDVSEDNLCSCCLLQSP